MLGVDDSRNTARFLYLRHGMDSQCGFTGRLRTVYLDDTSSRITAYAQRVVQTDTTGRNNGYILHFVVTQFHDGTLAIFFVNLCHRGLQSFQFVCRRRQFLCHKTIYNLVIYHLFIYRVQRYKKKSTYARLCLFFLVFFVITAIFPCPALPASGFACMADVPAVE